MTLWHLFDVLNYFIADLTSPHSGAKCGGGRAMRHQNNGQRPNNQNNGQRPNNKNINILLCCVM